MSGLNFLLCTIAALLILGAVAFVVACIYGFHVRKRAIEEISKRSGFMSRLKKAQAEQEELLKQQNKN